jgi:diguanylate cyclase (GGDEF)-like protein
LNRGDRNGTRRASVGKRSGQARETIGIAVRALHADRLLSEADQTSSDADQTSSDADQAWSASDQAAAASDQLASDRDQAGADRVNARNPRRRAAAKEAFERSRVDRELASLERHGHRDERSRIADERMREGSRRDQTSSSRDRAARARDALIAKLAEAADEREASLIRQMDRLRAKAEADRERAAADRARAAVERANLLREQTRLQAELRSAYLDDLTGAYRRDPGRTALTNEIARARRANGRFVLAFVDVDRLKEVNDRDGHAAGDEVLRTVVSTLRKGLRSFDPIVRYGGDEFVCGVGGVSLGQARRRFGAIGGAIEARVGVGISVGFARMTKTDTADKLTGRADTAMLGVKARRHSSDAYMR